MTVTYFYVAACATTSHGGIYRFELENDGTVRLAAFSPIAGCNYLAFSPDRKYLYSTCLIGEAGGVAAFKINTDLSLAKLNIMPSDGLSTCHLTTDASGRFLYCANYRTGTFTEFELNSDGSIKRKTKLIAHHGCGPNKERQECAHVHFTGLTPDKKHLCVVDLGIDAVKVYPLDSEEGVNEDSPAVCDIRPEGEGPRHLVFNQKGDTAYLLNELASSVSKLGYSHGNLTQMKTWSALPDGFKGNTKASAIRLSFDGHWLLASNRGCDSIAVFRVLPNGDLIHAGFYPVWGESPRDFDFIGDGSLLAITNENTDNMVICGFDANTGAVSKAKQFFSLPRPLCVLHS